MAISALCLSGPEDGKTWTSNNVEHFQVEVRQPVSIASPADRGFVPAGALDIERFTYRLVRLGAGFRYWVPIDWNQNDVLNHLTQSYIDKNRKSTTLLYPHGEGNMEVARAIINQYNKTGDEVEFRRDVANRGEGWVVDYPAK